MARFSRFLISLLYIGQAYGDELPSTILSAAINQDGRYEVFGVNTVGMLFHRWQTNTGSWGPWAPNFLGKVVDVDTTTGRDGRLFAFILDGGTLVVRAQQSPNGGWGDRFLRMGHDLRRIEATANQDGRWEVFALGADGSLYSIAQRSADAWLVESDWITTPLGGQALKEIAASRDGAGCLVAFALGGDGQVYFRKQMTPNGGFGSWSGLEGIEIQRISAARQAAGSITVFALGGDGALYSRTQLRPGQAWRSWIKVFNSHIVDWSAATGGDGLMNVAALVPPSVRFVTQAADGSYFPSNEHVEIPQGIVPTKSTGGLSLAPFVATDAPIGKLSLQRGRDGGLRLVVLNDAGEVYSILRPADPRSSGTWAGKTWEWLGTAPISINQPDIVVQMATCVDRLLPPNQSAEVSRIIQDDLPQRIANGGSQTPFAALARNAAIASVCSSKGQGNYQQTIGVWLSHQATPEVLSAFNLTGQEHSFGYRINANTITKAMDIVWDSQPKNLTVSGQSIRLLSKELEFVDNPAPTSDQIKLTVHAEATVAGLNAGLQATATAAFLIGKKDPLSRVEAPGPTCILKTRLDGEGSVGKIAEILLNAVGDLIDFSLSSAQRKVFKELEPVCSIADAIPRSQLLRRTGSIGPLQTLGIDYDSIVVNRDGITALAANPPLPRDRDPAVDWRAIDESLRISEYPWGRLLSFKVEAVTREMNATIINTKWTYDYPLRDATRAVVAQVTDEAGNNLDGPTFNRPRLVLLYSIPSGVDLNSLDLGTLKVTVSDADGQTVTAEREVR